MLKVNNIPSELINKSRLRFEANKDVRILRTAQQDAERRGDYGKALRIAQDLESLWTICLDNYIKKAEQEVHVIDTGTAELPLKDKDEMMEKMMVLFICCDIIESATIDLNDILHRTKPDVSITAFADLQQTLDLAKAKLKYLQETGDYMQDLVWADSCDNMYGMMLSKAKAIVRKRKESKNWGDNMKKFENAS